MAGINRVRRVLMTADTVGGVWTYALELARGLHRFGIQVELATMGAALSADQRSEVSGIENVNVHESNFKLEWMADPWTDVQRAGDWLLTLESDLAPDVVHLNGYAHGHLPWQAPHFVVGHSCVVSWWRAVKGESAPEEWNTYRFAVTRGLRAADHVVAPTRAMMNDLHRFYGQLQSTSVIANGRRGDQYHVRRKEPFVLAAGRAWDEAKNIRALAEIRRAIDWPVLVAGDDQHPDGEQQAFKHVRMLGQLPAVDLADWYSRAAIYCLPARYEPFGLSVLEAALSGCALVLGDIQSLRELWEGAAVFVPPDDREALEWRLRELIGNREYVGRLGARARDRARMFTVQRMTNSYLALYAHLLNPAAVAVAGD